MTEKDRNISRAPCRSCQHYFVTWDANAPHGCRAFGFKSKTLPYLDVKAASTLQCLQYSEKKKQTPL